MRFPMLVLAVALLSTTGACRSGAPDTPAEVLRTRLEDPTDPTTFSFVYSDGGSRVADCFSPNRTFSGDVDGSAGLMVLRDEGSDPIAYVAEGRAVLSDRLFSAGSVSAPWMVTRGRVTGPLRDALGRALGTGLAGYVADGLLPPPSHQVATDALAIAKQVRSVRSGDRSERFTLTLDGARLAAAAPEATATTEALDDPTLEVVLTERTITRITVTPGRPATPGPDDAEDAGGWVIDYLPLRRPVVPADVGPVAELVDEDAAGLSPPQITTCNLPVASPGP